MKAKIATRIPIKQAWLDEVAALIPGMTFELVHVSKQMSVFYKPDQQSMYGDFATVRQIVDSTTVDIRAFYMSYEELRALGITNHLALYDNADRDGVLDFYVGLQERLDPRAAANGFKSNFAWEFVHEALHGFEQNLGLEYLATNGDRTHAMEAQGRLKELLQGDAVTLPYLKAQVVALAAKLSALIKPKMIHPLALPYRNQITQQYGVENPIYKLTGHHVFCDYACPVGTPLRAPANGKLIVASHSPERGNYVQFAHDGYVLEMRHLSQMMPLGAYKQDDIIAHSGDTGNLTTGPHVCLGAWVGQDNLSIINQTNWSKLTIDPNILYV